MMSVAVLSDATVYTATWSASSNNSCSYYVADECELVVS